MPCTVMPLKQGNSAAAADDVECSADRIGMAGHFQHHIHAQAAGLLHDDGAYIFFRRIEDVVGVHLPRDLGAVLIHLNREYRRCADGLSHGNGKEPNWPTARDGNGFGRDLPGQHGMHGVAQRIENGRVVERNGGIELPDVRLRNHYVLGEGPVGVDADDLYVLADMGLASAALQTLSTGHVHFGGNEVALFHAGDFVAEGGDFPAEFVPGNQRRMNAFLRPSIPVINMQISSADGRDVHLNQDFVGAEGRNVYFANLRAGRGLRLDHRQHCCCHEFHLIIAMPKATSTQNI